MDEVVTDPTVAAKLPKATWQVQWQWRSWRITGGPVGTMRYANAKGYFLGPLFVCRPMPWLLGSARSLHPEAFEAVQAQKGHNDKATRDTLIVANPCGADWATGIDAADGSLPDVRAQAQKGE